MDGWQRTDGVDWLCVEPISGGDGSVEAGLVFGHGWAHEPPADQGIGVAAMGVLVRELTRPRETVDHRVVELNAAARVNLQDTVLRMTGSPEAVRLGLAALADLVGDPSGLDVTELPNPPTCSWSGWTTELTAWFGMGTAAFAAEYAQPWDGDPDRLRQLLRGLHPRHDRSIVGWTTDAELLGLTFGEPPALTGLLTMGSPSDAPALRWRDPSPVADGSRSVVGTFHNNLLVVRVPAQPIDALALRLLSRTISRNLGDFHSLIRGLDLIGERVNRDLLFAARAVPFEQGYDPAQTSRALDEAMAAYAGLSDATLLDDLAAARDLDALNLDLAPGSRAVDAHCSGRRLTRDELVGTFDGATVAELRHAIGRVRRGALFGVQGTHHVAEGRPIWQPPPVPAPTDPSWNRRSLVRLAMDGTDQVRPRITADSAVLEVTGPPKSNHGQGPHLPVRMAVDLTAIAITVDRGPPPPP